MATIYENLDTIKDSINRMKVALELPENTPLEDVTTFVEEGGGGADISECFYEETSGNRWYKAVKKMPPFKFSGISCDTFFNSCDAKSVDVSLFDTSNTTNMNNMFGSTKIEEIIGLEKLNTSKVATMNGMFSSSQYLKNIDLSNFDTSNVTSMNGMFRQCNANIIFPKNFASNCDNISYMFELSEALNIDLSNFDTSNVTTMQGMFLNCTATRIDLSNFNTSKATNMSGMFRYCTSLAHLDIRNFSFSSVTNYSDMFGSSQNYGVPSTCLIIVKDDTARTWITEKFNWLTNIKTVAELEG